MSAPFVIPLPFRPVFRPWIALLACGWIACGCSPTERAREDQGVSAKRSEPENLSHDETLRWIHDQRAWRRARKTKPIWARAVTAGEVGKEFQTADAAIETAKEGAWLSVGIAEEPWFQSLEKIEAKYDRGDSVTKQFAFDSEPHEYIVFHPKESVRNWVAQVQDERISSFSIRPGYDRETVLRSPAGGYVVKGDVADPYQDDPDDVWLVQQSLFESTYELMPETDESPDKK
jgi:hypothetical protein